MQFLKIQKYMETKLNLIPSTSMELPKKVEVIQPLIQLLREELKKILVDPKHDTSKFEAAKIG